MRISDFTWLAIRGPVLSLVLVLPANAAQWPLKISQNGRFLTDQANVPFLVHGDSPWVMPAALTTNEMVTYFDDRERRGFTAVLVQLETDAWVPDDPANRYGDVPFSSPGDFSTANDDYFAVVDFMLNYAKSKGIVVFAVPLYFGFSDSEGWADEMRAQTDANVRAYGEFLGDRYRNQGNIIWTMGGDRIPNTTESSRLNALRDGIASRDPNHLFSAHGLLSEGAVTYNHPWLDVNSSYTYSTALYADVLTAYESLK